MNEIKIRPITIRLDKERHLLFDLNAFEELENIYGDLDAAFKSFQDDTKKVKNIKNFLCAGLLHEDKDLTPTSVGTLVGYNNLTEITDIIWKAITQVLPKAKEDSESIQGE